MKTYIKALLVILSGCFNPDLSNITLLCNISSPSCPEHQYCNFDLGVCKSSMSPTTDMNASVMDMSATCMDISLKKDLSILACKSRLGLITASQVCARIGYRVLKDSSGLSFVSCSRLDGFFISDNYGYRQGNFSVCNSGGPAGTFVGWGCGKVSIGIRSDGSCFGFTQSVAADGTNGWQDINPPSVDGIQNSNPDNGVLCHR